jgi:putative SOS response-associated peptidase YedK
MCGRYTLKKRKKDIIEEYQQKFNRRILDLSNKNPDLNYNVTPGQEVAVIYCKGSEVCFNYHSWGLIPHWSKDKKIGVKTINARMETVAEKPSFKEAFFYNRCLVIADGYYEWLKKGKERIPYYFLLGEEKTFAFAGIRAVWQDGNEIITSCSIITSEAGEKLKQIHQRMPIILKPDFELEWINPQIKEKTKLFEFLNDNNNHNLNYYQVSNKVNNAQNNSHDLIKPVFTQMQFFS